MYGLAVHSTANVEIQKVCWGPKRSKLLQKSIFSLLKLDTSVFHTQTSSQHPQELETFFFIEELRV